MLHALALPLLLSVAQAQETIPTVKEVVRVAGATTCPDLPDGYEPTFVRTSRGLMLGAGDGTFRYGCPESVGDVADALVAVSPDGGRLMYLADGGIYRSDNGGCTIAQSLLPEGIDAVDLAWWRDGFWVLGETSDEDTDGGVLLRLTAEGWQQVLDWTEEFRPSAMLPVGTDLVWVVSVDPRVRIRRISFRGGISGDAPLGDMPEDLDQVESIDPRAADDDEAFFVLRRNNREWTWHALTFDGVDGPITTFTDDGTRAPFVVGPVSFRNQWWSVIENRLHTWSATGDGWVDSGVAVPFSCLHAIGERVFACAVDELLAVTDLSTSSDPVTSPVFSFLQVAPPDPACATAACEAGYATLATDLGLDPELVAVCPDGRTLDDLDPSGCECSAGGSAGGMLVWGWGLAGALLLRRRDPAGPIPRDRTRA